MQVGQTITGLVKSLDKGVSMVEIAGQTVAMRLPHPAAVGDKLLLRFAGHMPQPVFVLEPPETAAKDAPQLSQTARMLSELMQQTPGRNTPPTVIPPGPLLDQATSTQVAILALALRTTLVRSGLFYESHLANWVVGQDSLDGLLQEPQNRWPPRPQRAAPTCRRTPASAGQSPAAHAADATVAGAGVAAIRLARRGVAGAAAGMAAAPRGRSAQDRRRRPALRKTRRPGWESQLKLTCRNWAP
jgi:hypothetical protein